MICMHELIRIQNNIPESEKVSRFPDARGHIRTIILVNHSAHEYKNFMLS